MPAFRLSPVDFPEKENSVSAPMEISCNSADSDAPTCTSLLEDEGSQDSGVGFEKDHTEGFCFAAPIGMPPRRGSHLRVISEDTCSPQKYSPVKQGTSPQKFRSLSLTAVVSYASCHLVFKVELWLGLGQSDVSYSGVVHWYLAAKFWIHELK